MGINMAMAATTSGGKLPPKKKTDSAERLAGIHPARGQYSIFRILYSGKLIAFSAKLAIFPLFIVIFTAFLRQSCNFREKHLVVISFFYLLCTRKDIKITKKYNLIY
jgi:hypothetical protein